jgi:hypothetical protein
MENRKIISFSLWGNNKLYCCGAIANAKLAVTLFPGWTCRFYVADDVPKRVVRDLRDLGAEIIPKSTSMGFTGLFWRFEVADDIDVERFIVRDCDSRLTPRDAAMVKEWEESRFPVHIIRDCESHCAWICGATWGMVTDFLVLQGLTMQDLVIQFWQDYRDGNTEHGFESNRGRLYGVDQEFLSRKIFPMIRDYHMAHVANFNNLKFTGKERPVPPIDRKPGETNLTAEPYVGQVCNLEPEWENYETEPRCEV